MPRKPTIHSSDFPYHVTARTNNKDWFGLEMPALWKLAMQELRFIEKRERAIIHHFVLMNNHFHMILSTPKANISKIMYWLMKRLTQKIQRKTQRINKIFGGRYKACLITTVRYQFNAERYVLQNPIRANLCDKAEDYYFSTLYYSHRNIKLPFDLVELTDLSLSWINKVYEQKEVRDYKLALSRTKFQSPKTKNKRIPKI